MHTYAADLAPYIASGSLLPSYTPQVWSRLCQGCNSAERHTLGAPRILWKLWCTPRNTLVCIKSSQDRKILENSVLCKGQAAPRSGIQALRIFHVWANLSTIAQNLTAEKWGGYEWFSGSPDVSQRCWVWSYLIRQNLIFHLLWIFCPPIYWNW